MKTMKKFMASVLLVCMLASMFPVGALAEEGVCEHSFTEATCTTPSYCLICGTVGNGALGHTGGEASCTAQAVCCRCGLPYGETLAHSTGEFIIVAATCTTTGSTTVSCITCGAVLSYTEIPATGHTAGVATVTAEAGCVADGSKSVSCAVCGESYSEAIPAPGHSFADATCAAPKTCSVCGATEGEALGHSFADATCAAPKTCSVCGATEGEALGHSFADATCAAPKTCSVCGATEGEALGHSFADATCAAPKTCSVCGATEGEALGHSFADATCAAPKTCSVCGATEGEALGHSFADGICSICGTPCQHSFDEATSCEEVRSCSVCGSTAQGHEYADHICVRCGEKEPLMKAPAKSSTVTIISDNTVVHVGDSIALSAVDGNGKSIDVSWSSDDTAIATVSNGNVTGVAKGTVTITATATDGSAGTIEITVHAYSDNLQSLDAFYHCYPCPDCSAKKEQSAHTHVMGADGFVCSGCNNKYEAQGDPRIVSEYSENQAIVKGTKFNLRLENVPFDIINNSTWSSGNPEVISLDGNIFFGAQPFKANKAGTATITASFEGGSVSRTLSVVDEKVAATGITVSVAPSGKIFVGDTVTLTYKLTPENSTDTVEWSIDDTTIVNFKSQLDQGVSLYTYAPGSATITAKANGNVSASVPIEVLVPVSSITISGDTEVSVGGTLALTAAVEPYGAADKSVDWESSDDTIATVDETGKVTGIKAGEVTITATAKDGKGAKGTLKVTVKPVLVNEISITGGTEVSVGGTLALTAAVEPDNATDPAVTWKSSDDTIATVDETGKVTGIKVGDVTITATAKDSSGKAASKKVTVTAAVAPTAIKVTGDSSVVVGKTITLAAEISPADASDKTVSWKSSDSSIATVDEKGVVTGVKVGEVKITATSKADSELSVEHSVKVVPNVYLYYGNGTYFNGIHNMPFVSSDIWSNSQVVKVVIDGVPLVAGRDFSYYSSPSGMVGVTVYAPLLRLLSQNAWHTIHIYSNNGVASGYFATGYYGSSNVYGVKTGDDSSPMLWAMLCLLGLGGAGITIARSRKRKA